MPDTIYHETERERCKDMGNWLRCIYLKQSFVLAKDEKLLSREFFSMAPFCKNHGSSIPQSLYSSYDKWRRYSTHQVHSTSISHQTGIFPYYYFHKAKQRQPVYTRLHARVTLRRLLYNDESYRTRQKGLE